MSDSEEISIPVPQSFRSRRSVSMKRSPNPSLSEKSNESNDPPSAKKWPNRLSDAIEEFKSPEPSFGSVSPLAMSPRTSLRASRGAKVPPEVTTKPYREFSSRESSIREIKLSKDSSVHRSGSMSQGRLSSFKAPSYSKRLPSFEVSGSQIATSKVDEEDNFSGGIVMDDYDVDSNNDIYLNNRGSSTMLPRGLSSLATEDGSPQEGRKSSVTGRARTNSTSSKRSSVNVHHHPGAFVVHVEEEVVPLPTQKFGIEKKKVDEKEDAVKNNNQKPTSMLKTEDTKLSLASATSSGSKRTLGANSTGAKLTLLTAQNSGSKLTLLTAPSTGSKRSLLNSPSSGSKRILPTDPGNGMLRVENGLENCNLLGITKLGSTSNLSMSRTSSISNFLSPKPETDHSSFAKSTASDIKDMKVHNSKVKETSHPSGKEAASEAESKNGLSPQTLGTKLRMLASLGGNNTPSKHTRGASVDKSVVTSSIHSPALSRVGSNEVLAGSRAASRFNSNESVNNNRDAGHKHSKEASMGKKGLINKNAESSTPPLSNQLSVEKSKQNKTTLKDIGRVKARAKTLDKKRSDNQSSIQLTSQSTKNFTMKSFLQRPLILGSGNILDSNLNLNNESTFTKEAAPKPTSSKTEKTLPSQTSSSKLKTLADLNARPRRPSIVIEPPGEITIEVPKEQSKDQSKETKESKGKKSSGLGFMAVLKAKKLLSAKKNKAAEKGTLAGTPAAEGKSKDLDVAEAKPRESTFLQRLRASSAAAKDATKEKEVEIKTQIVYKSIPLTNNEIATKFIKVFPKLDPEKRQKFLLEIIGDCDPQDMRFLNSKLPMFHRDFFALLDPKIVYKILEYISPKDLVTAAHVSKTWNRIMMSQDTWYALYASMGLLSMARNFYIVDGSVIANANLFSSISNWVLGIFSYRNFQAHYLGILCMSFDGKTIATGSSDTTCKVFNIKNGSTLRTFLGHEGPVLCVQHDNDKVVTGSFDKTIRVWGNYGEGELLATMVKHNGPVTCMQMNDGFLVSGSEDKTVRLWDISPLLKYRSDARSSYTQSQSNLTLTTNPHSSGSEISLSVTGQMKRNRPSSPNGLSDGEKYCLRTLHGHESSIKSLDIYGDVIISGDIRGNVFLWHARSGNCMNVIGFHPTAQHPVQIGIDDATDLPRPPSQPILTEPIAEIQFSGNRLLVTTLSGYVFLNNVDPLPIPASDPLIDFNNFQVWATDPETFKQIPVFIFRDVSVAAERTTKNDLSDPAQTKTTSSGMMGKWSLCSKSDEWRLMSGGTQGYLTVYNHRIGKFIYRLQPEYSLTKSEDPLKSGSCTAIASKMHNANHNASKTLTSLNFDDSYIVAVGMEGKVHVWEPKPSTVAAKK